MPTVQLNKLEEQHTLAERQPELAEHEFAAQRHRLERQRVDEQKAFREASALASLRFAASILGNVQAIKVLIEQPPSPRV